MIVIEPTVNRYGIMSQYIYSYHQAFLQRSIQTKNYNPIPERKRNISTPILPTDTMYAKIEDM